MDGADERPGLVALDVEGVLLPEIWIAVAERTGIDELRRTTRDEPDYDVLMRPAGAARSPRSDPEPDHGRHRRAAAVARRRRVPRRGPRARTQVILLSDTFAQFAHPLMAQLGWPTIFCHDLRVAIDDRIVDYRLRLADQKRKSAEAFRGLRVQVVAGGDSYNDVSMLLAADTGLLFRAPPNVRAEYPQLYDDYDAFAAAIDDSLT